MKTYERQYGDYATALGKVAIAKQIFATPKEGMTDRMKQGVNSDACKRWAWFDASFNEVDGRILATRDKFNPLSARDESGKLLYAQRATDATRTGEFYLTNDVLFGNEPAKVVLLRIAEQDKKKPIDKRIVLDLGQTKTHDVPTDCYADDDTIVFLAEGYKRAGKYGLFVRNAFGENSIQSSRVYMQDLTGKDKVRGFALDRFDADDRSGFDCGRGLYVGSGSVFGGYERSAEGATQKIVPAYSAKDVRDARREKERLAKILQPDKLKAISGLLGKLR